MKVSALVVDDEQPAREELCYLLSQAGDVDVVAQAENGRDALGLLDDLEPDIVFLDVQMPGLTGFEVARQVAGRPSPPHIVFVTAYDQYAIDAFEAGAVDYLLKPVAGDRLERTVQRVQARIDAGAGADAALAPLLAKLVATLPKATPGEPAKWLTASSGNTTKLILVDDVLYFRADNKYTVVVTAKGEAVLRKPIKDLLAVLDPGSFKQIHRSTIVNLRAIDSIVRDDTGKGTLKLRERNETLTVSQPFMALFRSQ
jgi:DNA-binding LytR/AlgR family response regulator